MINFNKFVRKSPRVISAVALNTFKVNLAHSQFLLLNLKNWRPSQPRDPPLGTRWALGVTGKVPHGLALGNKAPCLLWERTPMASEQMKTTKINKKPSLQFWFVLSTGNGSPNIIPNLWKFQSNTYKRKPRPRAEGPCVANSRSLHCVSAQPWSLPGYLLTVKWSWMFFIYPSSGPVGQRAFYISL